MRRLRWFRFILESVVDAGGDGDNALVNDLRIASNEEVVR